MKIFIVSVNSIPIAKVKAIGEIVKIEGSDVARLLVNQILEKDYTITDGEALWRTAKGNSSEEFVTYAFSHLNNDGITIREE